MTPGVSPILAAPPHWDGPPAHAPESSLFDAFVALVAPVVLDAALEARP